MARKVSKIITREGGPGNVLEAWIDVVAEDLEATELPRRARDLVLALERRRASEKRSELVELRFKDLRKLTESSIRYDKILKSAIDALLADGILRKEALIHKHPRYQYGIEGLRAFIESQMNKKKALLQRLPRVLRHSTVETRDFVTVVGKQLSDLAWHHLLREAEGIFAIKGADAAMIILSPSLRRTAMMIPV